LLEAILKLADTVVRIHPSPKAHSQSVFLGDDLGIDL